MPITNTDAVLWYNVASSQSRLRRPQNWSDDIGSLNPQILDWCYLVGRIFSHMHHEDVDLRIPRRSSRSANPQTVRPRGKTFCWPCRPPAKNNMEVAHARPPAKVFRVFPVPFFLVRNQFMRRWREILMSLAKR